MRARLRWADAATAWMVDNRVFKSTDAGATWTDVSALLPGAFVDAPGLNDLVFTDSSHGWIVGKGGQVYATADGGASWTRQASDVAVRLVMASFVDAQTGWIATDDGRFVATATGGH